MGNDLGFYILFLNQNDPAKAQEGIDLMNNYFQAHPDDFYASTLYASLLERMGKADEATEVWEKTHEFFPDKSELSLKLVDSYLATRDDSVSRKKALDLIDRIQVAEGPSLQLTARRVVTYMNNQDTVAAVKEINSLMNATPTSAETRVYAGDFYMSLDEKEKALEYFNKACETDPSSGLAFYKRAGYYQAVGDSVGFDREVFHALELPDLELDTKLGILTGYVKELYTDSVYQPRINKLFNSLVDQYPHEPSVHDLYSSYFVAIKDYKSAAEQQEYVIDQDGANVERWRGLMSLYMSSGDYEAGTRTADRAISLFPDNTVLAMLAANAHLLNDDYDRSLEILDSALVKVDSLDVELISQLYGVKGDTEFKLGNVDAAIQAYEQAMKYDPTNSMAMNNCAYFMAVEGRDLDKAAELSARSLNLDPDNESSLDTYAWIMFKKGDHKEAKTFIDRALEVTESPSAELYQHAGDIYFMCGEPDKALEFWEEAAKLSPDDELLQRKIKHKTYFYK
ncbi:MAG: tetratricopeptide repeat protein [Muribaculaceae bacterium]|nr:tetratricopeptide repeat protein [Muribaculaceae bacterium]